MIVAVSLQDVDSAALVAELERRGGFRISTDDGRGWETPTALSLRLGKGPTWLCKLLARNGDAPGLEIDRAPGGRVRQVRASAEFLARFAPPIHQIRG